MAKQELSFDDWRKKVDELFGEETGCNWSELCGDAEPIKASYLAGETPTQFVDQYIDKNGLWDIRRGP
jgi:hypothetical protein